MTALKEITPGWQPYRPSPAAPWNARRIVHLYRRAAFGVTPVQLEVALQAGYDETIERLLSGRAHGTSGDAEKPIETLEEMQELLLESAISLNQETKLKAAWILRMLDTPDPLAEQLTLMWHNHFATSNLKVQNIRWMWQQNDFFRHSCRVPFGDLLRQILRDPAMLIWLDADANRKQSPNENLARELLELFTLGIGNYSERDVKEAARALTGRALRDGRCMDDANEHDPYPKTVLGRTERFTAHGLADLLSGQPATSKRLAWRICQHFLGEDVATAQQLNSLAAGLSQRALDINWAVKTVLRSEYFFSERILGRRISPPAVFVTSAVRALLPFQHRPSPVVLADWMAELGQDLFNPPNVGGWPGGPAWLSSQRMVARIRFAEALASGQLSSPSNPHQINMTDRHIDRGAGTQRSGRHAHDAQTLEAISRLLLGRSLGKEAHQALLSIASTANRPKHQLVSTLLSLPEAQLD